MAHSRQLAAIMFTDIAGYTAIMGEDELSAFELLRKNRQLQRPIIDHYGGRWIKELGDGVMATFSNATDAVLCAAAIQKSSMENSDLNLRIGINLGEVIFEDNDVFGDGVNIASRLQQLAPIGSIYISESVQKNVSNKRGIETSFIGQEVLKNVKTPIGIYSVNVENVQIDQVSFEAPIPETYAPAKSIAVLPFANLSSDPEQEYFSDGMAEEILNALTHLKDLKVVSRSSSFFYKGKNVDVQEIGSKLGVSTVLEGSVRRHGSRIRITTQLVNVKDGYHLWSDRYDREMDDIFKIQDEIALAVTEKMKVIWAKNEKKITKAPTENTEAYELYLKGRFYWNKRGRWLVNALDFFQQAVAIDKDFAKAHAGIADSYNALGLYGIIPPMVAMPKAKESALKAIELNPMLNEAFTSLGFIYGFYENDRYLAHKNFNHALELNSDYATGHYWYSFYLSIVENDLAKAEEEGLLSTELEPQNAIAYHITGLAFLAQRKFEQSMEQARKAIDIDAGLFLPYFLMGWCYIETGNLPKALEYLSISMNLSGRHSWPLGFYILAKKLSGNHDEAAELIKEVIQRESSGFFSAFGSGIAAAAVKDADLLMAFLERGREKKDILLPIFAHFAVMPEMIRTEPRVLQFLKELELVD